MTLLKIDSVLPRPRHANSAVPSFLRRSTWNVPALLLIGGLLTLPFQVVQVSIAQPGHLWLLVTLGFMVLYRTVRISLAECVALLVFLYFALTLTFLQDFPRIKHIEQVSKFAFFYPAFYFVGRWLGWRFVDRPIPLGYAFLFIFLAFQYATQALSLPIIYQEISFGQGALHGTFRERNWLAVYFLLFSYVLLLKDQSRWKFVPFFALNGVVMLLSGSKTAFVACGIIFLIQSRLPLLLKVIPAVLAAIVYMIVFSADFTEERINVRLEEERGLAFQASMDLIAQNPLGYGLGFVEAHFSSTWLSVRGLGEGTNSVFMVPLDLWIIAGVGGLLFWAVFFAGIGNRAMITLAPIAVLSLLNPMHQSEIVYFFIGMLVSFAHGRRSSGLPGGGARLSTSNYR